MKAYLISIGDELLIGQTINTNVAFIGQKLTECQFDITGSSVIADSEKVILDELDYRFKTNDIIIITGGLGPTNDDITRNAIVKYFNTELVLNEYILEKVKEFFAKRGRALTKVNEDQALVPKISNPLVNGKGTAPGIWIEKDKKILIALPGVPFEMKDMLTNSVIPRLQEINRELKSFVLIKTLLTTGIPESLLYDKIKDIFENNNNVKIAYLPNQFGVKLRLNVFAKNEEEAKDYLIEVEQMIRSRVGRYIYGINEISIEEVIARLLIDRQLKISVAESCTGGLICNRLTNINGSSSFFERGIITYSNGSKVELLNVQEDFIQDYGAVSLEVARQMAQGIKSVAGTDIGIAVTGIMGPTGGTNTKPVGLVYIGLCDDKVCTAKEFRFGDDRILNKERTSQAALEMLRRHLLGIDYDE